MDKSSIPDTGIFPSNTLLRGGDVAKILNISRSYAFLLMQRGEITTVRIGKSIRVRPLDLERFIARKYLFSGRQKTLGRSNHLGRWKEKHQIF